MKKLICLFALLLAGTANAGLILDIEGGGAASDGRNFMLGYSFSVNSAITIDGMGLWDEGADGFSHTQGYEIGLWENSGGSLLASVMVDNTSSVMASSNPNGQWMFSDIAMLALGVGDYTVGFYRPGSSDQWRFNTSAVNTIAQITFGDQLELATSSFSRPTSITGNADGHFGPNLRVMNNPIPEPASVLLLGLGLAGLGLSRRK